MWQDIVLMVGGFIFAPSLLFSIFGKEKPPIKTSLPTGTVLVAFAVVYVTLGLPLASIATSLTALCWFILAYQVSKSKEI